MLCLSAGEGLANFLALIIVQGCPICLMSARWAWPVGGMKPVRWADVWRKAPCRWHTSPAELTALRPASELSSLPGWTRANPSQLHDTQRDSSPISKLHDSA